MTNTLTTRVHEYVTERTGDGTFSGRTPQLMRNRLGSFAEHFGRLPLERLTETAIYDWLASIADRSQATRSAYLSSVRQFCRWMVRRKIITTDPCAEVPSIPHPRSIPRALPADAVKATIEACRDDRERAIVMLAVGCGLRRAEIATVRWCDYDERSRRLFVTGKGGAERLVPVPVEVARALAPIRGHAGAPIIRRHQGDTHQHLSPFTIWAIVNRVLTDAGVKQAPNDGVSTHAFRHTAASDVLDACGQIRWVQAMLGHRNLSSTEVYLRIADLGDVATAMEGRDYGVIDLAEQRATRRPATKHTTDRPPAHRRAKAA